LGASLGADHSYFSIADQLEHGVAECVARVADLAALPRCCRVGTRV
jgi:hypothetical protein